MKFASEMKGFQLNWMIKLWLSIPVRHRCRGLHCAGLGWTGPAETLNNFKFAFIWIAGIDRWKNLQFNQKKSWKDFQARPGLLQNLTESYWDFIIQVCKSLWKFYCPSIKKLYWNIFANKIQIVEKWKSAFLFPTPGWQLDVIFSGEKQNLMWGSRV